MRKRLIRRRFQDSRHIHADRPAVKAGSAHILVIRSVMLDLVSPAIGWDRRRSVSVGMRRRRRSVWIRIMNMGGVVGRSMGCCWGVRRMSVRRRAMMGRVDTARCWWMRSVIVGRWRSRFHAQKGVGRRQAARRRRMDRWKAGLVHSIVETLANEPMTVASTSAKSAVTNRQLQLRIVYSLQM